MEIDGKSPSSEASRAALLCGKRHPFEESAKLLDLESPKFSERIIGWSEA